MIDEWYGVCAIQVIDVDYIGCYAHLSGLHSDSNAKFSKSWAFDGKRVEREGVNKKSAGGVQQWVFISAYLFENTQTKLKQTIKRS